jgi:putative addiction module component (TIGR02574 family)
MNIQELSVSEKIILVEKLWDSILDDESEIELTENQKLEIDRRISLYSRTKNIGEPWSEVKRRIISNK